MEQTLQIGIFGDSISKGIVLDAETHRYSSLKKKSPNGFPLPLPCITSLLWAAPFKRAYLLSLVTPTNSQVIRMSFWNLAETIAILTGVPFQNDHKHTMNRIPH